MDPANFGGVKGKVPASVLYGEVLQSEQAFSFKFSFQQQQTTLAEVKMNVCTY